MSKQLRSSQWPVLIRKENCLTLVIVNLTLMWDNSHRPYAAVSWQLEQTEERQIQLRVRVEFDRTMLIAKD